MQNGSKTRVVADTNVYFMSLYNPLGKAAEFIRKALEGKVSIYSPDTVKEELIRLLQRKFEFNASDINDLIIHLPVSWVERELYENFMKTASVISHKPDRPVLATAIAIGCGIITTNRKHFLPARKFVKVWNIDDLLQEIGK